METGILFILVLGLLFLGVPVAVSLGLSSIIVIAFFSNDSMSSVAQQLFTASQNYTLLAIPFFVLASAFMSTGGVARRIIKPGQVFSRIHVADIASTLLASIRQPDVPGPFNLADEAPAPQADVVTEACRLLGVTPPPEEDFETAQMSEMMRSFYSASRRVSGEATRKALGVTLEYPTYREGLAAIYAAST